VRTAKTNKVFTPHKRDGEVYYCLIGLCSVTCDHYFAEVKKLDLSVYCYYSLGISRLSNAGDTSKLCRGF
jgi:hypothetical protein